MAVPNATQGSGSNANVDQTNAQDQQQFEQSLADEAANYQKNRAAQMVQQANQLASKLTT